MPNEIVNARSDAPESDGTLGGRIQTAREARGLSIPQLAHRAGVLTNTLRNWELDRSEPRVHKLQLVAGVLRVPMMWLLGGLDANFDDTAHVMTEETSDLSNKLNRIIDFTIVAQPC
ncbi:MAG: helix-turn-helix transcriptional regulator, partial [Rhodospirillales bacterium]|nr:helix-turn-helix transcriptional regulator [Rhodospirillales bacterium]